MNTEKFNLVINSRLDTCKEVLIQKAKEYVVDDDRLHNFNVATSTAGKAVKCREQALWGMANKHLVSIIDIIDTMNEDPTYIPEYELVSEKITDMLNYLLLLEASIADKRDNQEKKPF